MYCRDSLLAPNVVTLWGIWLHLPHCNWDHPILKIENYHLKELVDCWAFCFLQICSFIILEKVQITFYWYEAAGNFLHFRGCSLLTAEKACLLTDPGLQKWVIVHGMGCSWLLSGFVHMGRCGSCEMNVVRLFLQISLTEKLREMHEPVVITWHNANVSIKSAGPIGCYFPKLGWTLIAAAHQDNPEEEHPTAYRIALCLSSDF